MNTTMIPTVRHTVRVHVRIGDVPEQEPPRGSAKEPGVDQGRRGLGRERHAQRALATGRLLLSGVPPRVCLTAVRRRVAEQGDEAIRGAGSVLGCRARGAEWRRIRHRGNM